MKRARSGVEHRDLPFIEHVHLARVLQKRRDRRGEEVLVLAHADDQRALAARSDEQVGVLGAHRDEREVAASSLERRLHRRHEVALVEVRDQVRDDLGVCV